jgi:hypothetical protein
MTDLVLCGSKDSRSDFLVARNAAWHRSRCGRTVWLAGSMSWSNRGGRRVSETEGEKLGSPSSSHPPQPRLVVSVRLYLRIMLTPFQPYSLTLTSFLPFL